MKGGGRRQGGRKKGVPNKLTVERQLLAQRDRELLEAAKAGDQDGVRKALERQIAKEGLEEAVGIVKGMVGHFQREAIALGPDGRPIITGDLGPFRDWLELWIKTLAQLAPYQSPTFKSIAVAAPPPEQTSAKRRSFTLKVFDGMNVPQIAAPTTDTEQ